MLQDSLVGLMGAFQANPIQFFGADTVYNSTATGISDQFTGSASFWFRKDGGDGTQMFMGSYGGVILQLRSDNKLDVVVRDPTLNILCECVSTNTYLAGATWHHLAASWNTNFSAGNKLMNLYVDGVNDKASNADVFAATVVGHSAFGNHVSVGSGQIHSAPYFIGAIAEPYFNHSQYIDFSVAANVQKFRQGGHPVSLGADGSLPSGSQPAMYLHNPLATVTTNQGFCGAFSIFGSPADANTRP